MALSAAKNVPRRGTGPVLDVLEVPLAANAVVHAGGLVVLQSGYGKAGLVATGLKVAGRAQDSVDNTGGSNGAKKVRCDRGVFLFKNSSAGDAIAQADVLADCYIVDDETVAKTSGSSTRSVAGRVMEVDSAGVWVEIN